MAADNKPDGDTILLGGPRDGAVVPAGDAAVFEVEIAGLVHRYVTTTKQREERGRTYHVFNYDGEIDPKGAMPGVEHPREVRRDQ